MNPELIFLSKDEIREGGILIVMVGPPGSGKTTLAREITQTYNNFAILSPTDIRLEMTGNASDRTMNKEVFIKLFSRANLYLSQGYNVIYDATNCRISHRRRIISATSENCKKRVCILFNVSLSECMKNNDAYDNPIPEKSIENMYITLRQHQPTITEGFDIIVNHEYK